MNILATSNHNFKIKNGLTVEGASATINGNDVLTSASSIDNLNNVSITTPADSQVLAYEAATSLWKNVNPSGGSGGSSVTISATAPASPTAGNVWFNSSEGTSYIYYDSFWVPISPPKAGATGDPGVVISASEPSSTDILWLDSDEVPDVPVPSGGTTGQVLAKSSSTDYDTGWVDTLTPTDVQDLFTPLENDIAALEAASIFPVKLNQQTISANYSIPVGYNGLSAGPITIADGVTVTIPDGSSWSVV